MKRKKSKLFIKIIAGLAALGAASGLAVICLLSPVNETVSFRLEQGAAVSSVAAQLKERNVIYSEAAFKISVLFFGGRVQSGEYEIPPRVSAMQIAGMLARGYVATTTVVIPEGMTVKQIKNLLNADKTLTGDVECVDAEKEVCNLKEGDLFPDTYRVPKGIGRLAVLEVSRKKMAQIKQGWEYSDRPMPAPLKSWNDVLTLASIVQKETPKVSEMPLVASVYLNRLKKKMRLQADPTVVYALTNGLGDMGGRGLFTGHLKTSSPYNTYINYGLPPAPIANVGRAAIAAVLNPADTTYLFFVADGTGGHKFARSYEEHKKNHADWRKIKKMR